MLFTEAILAPRHAFVRVPGLVVIDRPGWLQLLHPEFRAGGFNEVAHAALDLAEADRIIDATIATYRARGLAFRWYVSPDSAPDDLGARLHARGLHRIESLALARETHPLEGGAHIEPVTAATVGEYTATMARAWGLDAAPLARANELTLASPHHRLYLARLDGEPVATSQLVLLERSAHLLGGVVMPTARHQGLYRAMVARRLADARAAGKPLVTTRAIAATSAPILQRLGFEVVTPIASYHDRPSDTFTAARARLDAAYRALSPATRAAFDRTCAERALAVADDPIVKERTPDDHTAQIAAAVTRATLGATRPAVDDPPPTSADETRIAVALATYLRTLDLAAADAARDAELRWQLAQLGAPPAPGSDVT